MYDLYDGRHPKTLHGTVLALRSLLLLFVASRVSRPALGEQPRRSIMCWLPEWRRLLQCGFEEEWLASCALHDPKRDGDIIFQKEFRFLACCMGKRFHEVHHCCPRSHQHTKIQQSVTRGTATYSRGVTEELGRLFLDSIEAQRRQGSEFVPTRGSERAVVNELMLSARWKGERRWAWQCPCHINLLESEVVTSWLKELVPAGGDCRSNLILDSNVTLCSTAKGRSPSEALRAKQQHIGPLCVAGGVVAGLHFTPSRFNVADDPTRHRAVREPIRPLAAWFKDPLLVQWLGSLPALHHVRAAWLRFVLVILPPASLHELRQLLQDGRRHPAPSVLHGPVGRRFTRARWVPTVSADEEVEHEIFPTDGSWLGLEFDSTLGYPGEGPVLGRWSLPSGAGVLRGRGAPSALRSTRSVQHPWFSGSGPCEDPAKPVARSGVHGLGSITTAAGSPPAVAPWSPLRVIVILVEARSHHFLWSCCGSCVLDRSKLVCFGIRGPLFFSAGVLFDTALPGLIVLWLVDESASTLGFPGEGPLPPQHDSRGETEPAVGGHSGVPLERTKKSFVRCTTHVAHDSRSPNVRYTRPLTHSQEAQDRGSSNVRYTRPLGHSQEAQDSGSSNLRNTAPVNRSRKLKTDPAFVARRSVPLPAGRPMATTTRSDRMRFLQDLQNWMTECDIGALQHWLADSIRDPCGLNELLVVYGQHLWKTHAPYRKFSETVNAISMPQPLVRRQLGLCWDLSYMWMSKEPHEHRTAIPLLVHSALCARGLCWGWPRVVGLLCAARCGLLRPGEFLLATRRLLVLPRDVGFTVSFAQFIIEDPKARYVAARVC